MLNSIFSKKVQGQKHPGRWGIVEHQIPSIKVLFKTNTKGHKHPSNRLLSKSKTQYIYIYMSYNRTHIMNAYTSIYIYILTQSFWTGTKVIRRKHIVQPTGFGACSSTCCQWDGEDMPAPWERSNSHPPARVQKSVSINSNNRTYAVEEFLSAIPNSVIVWSLQ